MVHGLLQTRPLWSCEAGPADPANGGVAYAAERREPIEWHVSDDRFQRWPFFEGDVVMLAPHPEPMNETGLYAVNGDGEFRLVHASVPIWGFTGEPTDNGCIRIHPDNGPWSPVFNRHSPDVPKGHRILWHRPKYRLGWQREASS